MRPGSREGRERGMKRKVTEGKRKPMLPEAFVAMAT